MNQKLSIIIPAYNEENRIGKTLFNLIDYLEEKKIKAEIIVVDDGSSDHTALIVSRFSRLVKLVPVVPNRGKGYAIKAGILESKGDLILFMDADLATPLFEIENILKFQKESDDIVIGRRDHAAKNVKRTVFRAIAGNVFKFLAGIIVPISGVTDTQCGFKLFNHRVASEVFSRVKVERWCFDMEVLYLAQKLGFSISEMPISWEDKSGSKVRMLRDSFLMIKDLLKIRFMDISGAYNVKELVFKKGQENELFGPNQIEKSQEL